MRYLVEKSGQKMDMMESTGEVRMRIPMELKELLDEIAQYDEISERAKREILDDTDSRNVSHASLFWFPGTHKLADQTLLMLSIERKCLDLVTCPMLILH